MHHALRLCVPNVHGDNKKLMFCYGLIMCQKLYEYINQLLCLFHMLLFYVKYANILLCSYVGLVWSSHVG